MGDITDIRCWPPLDADSQYLEPDPERLDHLVAKAQVVRDYLVDNGVPTTPADLPFPQCGCYLCDTESLSFPEEITTAAGVDDLPIAEAPEVTAQTVASAESEETDIGSDNNSRSAPHSDAGPRKGSDSRSKENTEFEEIQPGKRRSPPALRDRDLWVVWDRQEKIARAPWQDGTMYPARWAESQDVNPRRSFEKARMVVEMHVEDIHHAWPFPDAPPKTVEPAILLRHDPTTPPITVVDFDDVRDPDSGAVSQEVASLIERFDGFTEISQSGTGLHTYVRGSLPDGKATFSAPLAAPGRIEMYDHSRFIGGTWQHASGTPTQVPVAPDAIANVIQQYDVRNQVTPTA